MRLAPRNALLSSKIRCICCEFYETARKVSRIKQTRTSGTCANFITAFPNCLREGGEHKASYRGGCEPDEWSEAAIIWLKFISLSASFPRGWAKRKGAGQCENSGLRCMLHSTHPPRQPLRFVPRHPPFGKKGGLILVPRHSARNFIFAFPNCPREGGDVLSASARTRAG